MVTSKTSPTVYTIPFGVPFLDALAQELISRHGASPLELSRVTVLLPTRRAVRGLRDAFLRAGDGRPRLLPVMRPIGDVDEEDLAPAVLGPVNEEITIRPEIPALRRQFLLARLILSRPDGPDDPVRAVQLARELGSLLDQVHTERLSFDSLDGLVPEEYAAHWQLTLDFLRIVTDNWPKILDQDGVLDPSDRRNRVIDALADGWRRSPPSGPVIAAGSTGSIPVTAGLLRTISRLPRGAVVLPGLDPEIDDRTWSALDPSHPQFGMKQVLERIGVSRHEVEPWPVARSLPRADPARIGLMAAALRPAETTDQWPMLPIDTDRGLQGLSLIEAPGPTEEAGAIALLMRATLETAARTAALITPDRDLARRVAAELRRWDIEVDDSAGLPLGHTAPGSFLRLSAEMISEKLAPVPLLAALKHPFAAGGVAPHVFRGNVRALERRALRGPRPAAGFEGLRAVLHGIDGATELLAWIDRLAQIAKPLDRLMAAPRCELVDLVRAHVAFAEALAATDDAPGRDRLWAGENGAAAAAFIRDLLENSAALPPVAPQDYPALFTTLISTQVVRPRYGRHPRVFIWGPLEARLQHTDLVILGGLNEGTWPPDPPNDPWLSRPMRQTFGLPSPERRIGLSAHDFAHAACFRQVVLCRAEKVAGSPTVPARWLLRLKALIGDDAVRKIDQTAVWAGWHRLLDTPRKPRPVSAPRPKPPVDARPRQLSVTGVETWMRDPYSIFARHILKLKPLQGLDIDPGAADRGIFIHQALETFVRAHGAALPDDRFERLVACGRSAFGDAMARPSVWAFWWPRFLKIARWFLEQEEVRRADALPIAVEVTGRLELEGPGGPFLLTAKADRIDRMAAGGVEIIDYKTGATPTSKKLHSGYYPQLPLEAAIAMAGGFDGIPPAPVGGFSFWRLTGRDPAGEINFFDGAKAGELAVSARDDLINLIAVFDQVETPYLSRPRPRPEFTGYGDYDHLARVKEWS